MKATRFTYAAMALLGSVAITVSAGTQAAAQPITTPPDTTAPSADSTTNAPCALLHVVVTQGTTESTEGSMPKQDSGTLSAAILPVLAEFGGTTSDKFDRTYVPYPADYGFTGTSYKDSAARGVENAAKIIADEAARCPNTKFGLLGYSQGAAVASELLRLIGAGQGPIPPARVAMGMLYSDPTRKQGDGIFPGAPSQEHPAPAPGTRGAEVTKLETLPTPPSDGGGIAPLAAQTPVSFGSLTGRVASACASGDIACDTPADAPLARLVTNVSGQMNLDAQDPIGVLWSAAQVMGTTALKMGVDVVNEDITSSDGTTRGLDYRPGDSLSNRAADASNPTHEVDAFAAIDKVLGIGINTAVTFAKKVLTMDNIAQLATVGLTNPPAALALLGAKAAEAALQLVPANITDKTTTAVSKIVQNELTDNKGLIKMATDVKYWAVRANHESYQRDAVTPSGGTWLSFASDWITALVKDLESGSTAPTADKDAFARTVPVDGQGSYQGLPGLQFQVGAQPSTTSTAFDPWAESSSTLTTPTYTPQAATDADSTSTATTSAAPSGDAFPMEFPAAAPDDSSWLTPSN